MPGLIFSVLSFLVAIPSADQSVQLDGHTLQRLDFLSGADALRARLHRPLHHGRADGIVPRLACHRRSFERHLLHRRAFSLHHGGRRRDGLSRRHSFLVAENHRAIVSGRLGALRRAGHLRRLQPHILPAIHAGLPGDAASLRRVSRGIPGAKRNVIGGRLDPGDRLPDSAHLLNLVHALRASSRTESLGREGT